MFTEEQLANRKKWVAELRSGKYAQGEGMLCHDGQYCCLGVAAEGVLEMVFSNSSYLSGGLRAESLLGYSEAQKMGVYGEQQGYAGLNDEHHLTFNQIADYIEKENENGRCMTDIERGIYLQEVFGE